MGNYNENQFGCEAIDGVDWNDLSTGTCMGIGGGIKRLSGGGLM